MCKDFSIRNISDSNSNDILLYYKYYFFFIFMVKFSFHSNNDIGILFLFLFYAKCIFLHYKYTFCGIIIKMHVITLFCLEKEI